jgi:NAD(P)H-hydrate epimerase
MAALLGYTAAQVRAAEQPLLDAGTPLMRQAAAALAAELRSLSPDRVLLLVGTGDNGGDALYAGAELAADGVSVVALPVGERINAGGAAAARDAGVRFVDAAAATFQARSADLVVDGILGTGSRGALRGTGREVVAAVLAAGPKSVVAVDLPSGIGADDGRVDDPTVLRADVTVTFGAIKAGLLLEPGARYAGRLVLVDLGLELEGEPVVISGGS